MTKLILFFTVIFSSVLPYQSIYQNGHKGQPNIILPVNTVKIRIRSYERSTSHLLKTNPNLYVIEVKCLSFKWTLKRRYKHFQHLHNQLQLLRTSLNIPFPSKTHREQRASFKEERFKGRTTKNKSIPRFPLRPEALISTDQMEQRMSQLEDYLRAVLDNVFYRNHRETLSFLEISRISFTDQLGDKRKEGWLKKKCNHDPSAGCVICFRYTLCQRRTTGVWKRRWIFIKDSFVGYLRPETGEIGCVLLMDQDFKVRTGTRETGLMKGLVVSNACRELFLKNWTKREMQEWAECLQHTMNSTGQDFIQSDNRFGSFVPVRENNKCCWFVDGCSFLSAVADAIESATEDIMIADWWLSPEIYMKRPIVDGNTWRLDTILRRKAEEGVQIFILLYKEVELALGINSLYSKKALSSIHPNIKVLRHPDHISGTATLLWAHHEKLVIIDQCVAFVGGIDLCYGRWDDENHRLTDLGSVGTSYHTKGASSILASHTAGQKKPGAIFHLAKNTNLLTIGTVTVDTAVNTAAVPTSSYEEEVMPNMDNIYEEECRTNKKSNVTKIRHLTHRGKEWAEELKDDGKVWVEKHFSANREKQISKVGINNRKHSHIYIRGPNQISMSVRENEEESHNSLTVEHELYEGSTKLWVGKDYTNFIVKDFDHLDQPLKDSVDRTTTPRMPWHDIGCAVWGKTARDVARHFVQRWNAVKIEKVKGDMNYPYLVPKSYVNFISNFNVERDDQTYFADCQVLRSSTTWSVGSRNTEDSIHKAYIHLIKKAEHFIYLENQFFISLVGASQQEVSNGVGQALYERIILAHAQQTRFRVIVVLPLLPGFEGQIGTASGIAMQTILHWNYASISRGSNSLLVKLRDANIDPLNYISFYGLRTHSRLNKELVTELIYVHSKLMIVDDKTVICGSANINDRSLLGKRDSEIAIVVQDNTFVESVMDGQRYQAGKFALSLRKRLFREHLGLLKMGNNEISIEDPVADCFYKETWIRIAARNTKIYEEVFRCIPCDEVTSFAKLREYQSCLPLAMTEPSAAEQKLLQIQGQLVLLPLHFMNEEDLTPATGTPEALLPTSLWT